MPRAGGESGKLGDRYEGIWIGDNLLDLIAGHAVTMTVEPFGEEAVGIEFRKNLPDATVEYHSVKRQTTGSTWTLYDLTATDKIGRSILGDLLEKQKRHAQNRAVFVSATTPNELNELWERALRSGNQTDFDNQVATSGQLHRDFTKYVEPLCQQLGVTALEMFRRLRVAGITESELIRQIEFKIRLLFYRPDGEDVNAEALRLLLPEIAKERLGQELTKDTIISELQARGYYERDWAVDQHVRDTVATLNANYQRIVESELINGAEIPRPEAKVAFEQLRSGSATRFVLIAGPAGGGKSCSLVQIAASLDNAKIPFLALRLDIQTDILTSAALGKEMGLRISPVGVLAGITNGADCVLIIDQVDALSFASGRNPQLWNVFQEILSEVEKYPNMRVLIACRAFDLENDARLRRLVEKRAHRINLGPLPLEMVTDIVTSAGVNPAALGPRRLEMLGTPLHLSLYLQGEPGAYGTFQSVQDLYRRYWDEKKRRVAQRLRRDPRWLEVIEKLASELSKRQTLSAPEDILDAFSEDAGAMASENILVLENRRYRFFHEGFFDYAFARCFAQSGERLGAWLTRSEQHLFRRAQVRQILAYHRGREFDDYLEDLRDVLTDERVRFHLKKLVLQWLRQLDDPSEREWEIVYSLWSDSKLGKHVHLVPHDSVAWFDLLVSLGIWAQWLTSGIAADIDYAVWLLSLPEVMRLRSSQVVELVTPHWGADGDWERRFRQLLGSGNCHQSREIFDLLLSGLAEGWLDAGFNWSSFYSMPDRHATLAAELSAHHLDRLLETALKLGYNDPFVPETRLPSLRPDFLEKTGQNAPEQFVRYLLPRAIYLVVATAETFHGKVFDRIWPYKVFGNEHNEKDGLLGSLRRAMCKLAKEKPNSLDTLTVGLETLPHETIAFLLESAWAANGRYYADQAVQYLLGDSPRFEIGYSMWARGSGSEAVSCELLRAITPHCSDANYAQLEALALDRVSLKERDYPQSIGLTQLHLLTSITSERLSEQAKRRLGELQRKFPGEKCDPPRPIKFEAVPSPIPPGVLPKLTDEQWLLAMIKYGGGETRDLLKGDVHQLSGDLEIEAQQDKERFADLALKMGEEMHIRYFSAILSAIVTEQEPSDKPRQVFGNKRPVTPGPPLDTAKIVEVIRRLHALPQKPCGLAICRAVSQIAFRTLPDEILDIISFYAINDPDPDRDIWQIPAAGGALYYGGSAITHGINTVRGAAVRAIGHLLFAAPSHYQTLEPALVACVRDPSLAVRACAVEALLPVLGINRDCAVKMFLELCDGADAILGTAFIDHFLRYATSYHYKEVRPLLQKMLTFPDKSAQQTAARQICLASFHDNEAQGDMKVINDQDEEARAAAAEVYAANLGQAMVSDLCREGLKAYFQDSSNKVRAAASGCFRQISGVQLSTETDLLGNFIESPAFPDGVEQLLFALDESVVQLPDIVCRIPERVIELHQASGAQGAIDANTWTYMMPPHVLRLYEQTRDPQTKARCLNIIDQMIEQDFGSIQTELIKVER